MANTGDLDENEARVPELTLGKFIRYRFDQMDVFVNMNLLKDCLEKSGFTEIYNYSVQSLI